MDGLVEDGFKLVDFELGLEVGDVGRRGEGGVGTAAGVGHGEALVHNDVTDSAPSTVSRRVQEDDLRVTEVNLPVALATAVLLDLLGVGVGKAVLGEELGEVLHGEGSALSNALVVAVVGLVGAGHFIMVSHQFEDIFTSPTVVDDQSEFDQSDSSCIKPDAGCSELTLGRLKSKSIIVSLQRNPWTERAKKLL